MIRIIIVKKIYQKGETYEKKETKTENKRRKKSKISGLKEEFKLDKESLIPISKEPINKYYKILNNLGQGSFGQIKKVINIKISKEKNVFSRVQLSVKTWKKIYRLKKRIKI